MADIIIKYRKILMKNKIYTLLLATGIGLSAASVSASSICDYEYNVCISKGAPVGVCESVRDVCLYGTGIN